MHKSDALIESQSLRQSYMNRTDVLEKVKNLALLPDDLHVTMDMAANYYEVHNDAIESIIRDHKEELMSDGLEVLKGVRLSAFKAETGYSSRAASLTIIPRCALLRIGMLLRDSLVARSVRDHLLNVESERTSRYDDPSLIQFKKEVFFLEAATEILRLPESGKLKLMGDFNKRHGLQVPLPAYADEPVTESATVLLEKYDAGIKAQAFNLLLIKQGLLEEKQRPSSKGGTKSFKSLTDAGLAYGKNIISPNNPRETQPHYYADRFGELLQVVGLRE